VVGDGGHQPSQRLPQSHTPFAAAYGVSPVGKACIPEVQTTCMCAEKAMLIGRGHVESVKMPGGETSHL
jgi:hypothetical protein